MKIISKIIYKTTIVLIILGFFINPFSVLPFTKIKASTGNLQEQEIILNEEYLNDDNTKIIQEVEEMRSENSKVFKTNSGIYEYHYYNNLIHTYEKDKGYEEIDSSFKEDSNEYTSDSINYNVKIPKKISENKKIKLSYENTKIEITYNDIDKQAGTIISNESSDITNLNRLNGKVKYNNIYENVDLELVTNSTSLKENIIINKFKDSFSFSYNIIVTNLSMQVDDSYIYFFDEEGKLIYHIDPYFMIDANNNVSYDVNIQIEEIKKNNYKITVIPNSEYLKDASYPVIIDPTITYESNLLSSYINIKNLKKGSSSVYDLNYISTFKYIDDETNIDESELSIMKLNLSNLPDGVMFSSAQLILTANTTNAQTEPVTLSDIQQTSFNFETVNGLSSYSKTFISTQEHINGYIYSFDILEAIKKDTDDVVYLEFSPEKFSTSNRHVGFYSFGSTYESKLVLKYYETSGLKDYWTYHSSDLGDPGIMYINDFSGNLVIQRNDYLNNTERTSFNITSYYNSNLSDVNLGYGNGWRFNYCDFIKNFTSVVGTDSFDYYTHIDGTGHKSYYEYQRQLNPNISASAEYLSEEGDDSIIEIGASYNDYYRRIVNDEITYKYNTSGELVFIDRNDAYMFNNSIYIEYTTLESGLRVISKITDAVGNRAIFTYYATELLATIEIEKKIIENEVSRWELAYTIEYGYDNNKNLIYAARYTKDMDNILSEVGYSYNENNKLISAKKYEDVRENYNCVTNYMDFTYDIYNEKIINYSYKLYDGTKYITNFSQMNITYDYQKTIFTSSDGYKTYYSFDSYGHTINVYDSDGYAKFYKYECDNENNFLNNKLVEESEPVYYKYNKIVNHGFENYTSNDDIVGWNIYNNVSLSSDQRLYGEYAARIASTGSYMSQTIKLKGNTTYSLSYFVKVNDNMFTSNDGLYIEIISKDSSGNYIVNYNELIEPNEKFEEKITTFTLNGYNEGLYDVTIKFKTANNTTAYIDNVQFITGINDCRYNMLKDSSFENSYLSSNPAWTGGETVECNPNDTFGYYNRYIPANTTLKQVLDINMSEDTKISFGGFVEANKNDVSIRVRFYNIEEDSYSSYYTIKYNKNVEGYQYLINKLELDNDYNQIEFEVVNNGNRDIYVDNLILMQDIFTNTYTFNEYGKTKIVKKPTSSLEYIRDDNGRVLKKIIKTVNNKSTTINIDNTKNIDFENNTINIDGYVNNVTTTTYTKQGVVNSHIVVGTFETQYFVTSTYYSDSDQYISEKVDEFGYSTKYEYNNINGLLEKVTDALNIDTNYNYDEYERLIEMTRCENTISYEYNIRGLIEYITLGNSSNYIKYHFEYNDYLDIKKISYTSNTTLGYKTIVEYEYYLKDNLYTGEISKIINPNGSYILYKYDNTLKLTEVWKKQANQTNEVLITKYTYNEINQVSIFYDGRTEISYYYSYDLEGKLIQIIDSKANKIMYTYEDDKVIQINYDIDNTTDIIYYSYDNDGNLVSVISNNTITTLEPTSDPLGRYFNKIVKNDLDQPVLSYNYTYCVSSNKITDEETYDDNLASTRIESQEIIVGDIKYTTIYEYDELGNISIQVHSKEKINLETNETIEELEFRRHFYTYDEFNRLINETVNNEEHFTIYNCNYAYDLLGNLTGIERTIKEEEYSSLPSVISYYYADSQDKTKLTNYEIDGTVYTLSYDTYNNLTNYNNYDITFTEGKITSLSQNNQDKIRYTYDATGRRIKKEIYNNTTSTYDVINYIYLENTLLKEVHSDKEIIYIFDDTGVIGFTVKTNTTEEKYYYIKNLQQDVLKIVDENLNEVISYIYDAYGNIINIEEVESNTIGKLNPYRYRGYYYDNETSLYWLSSRYYSPELCRFISPDDVKYLDPESVNGLNLYCYCYNDPINYYDPSGHFVITATIGLSTAAYYAIIALLAVTAVATTAYVESETHIIQNSLTSLGNAIVDLGESISTGIDNLFNSSNGSSNNINNTIIGSSAIAMSSSIVSAYGFENVYYYKRKKAAPRIKSNSKKKAREKAFLKGGKRPPIHHPYGKYGPHYHPNDPRFSHWHYYYLWLFLFGDDEE